MEIDELIEAFTYFRNHPATEDSEVILKAQVLFDTAIDIFRRYEEITEILDDSELEAWEVLEQIKEALKTK